MRVRLDYAAALYYAGYPATKAVEVLELAVAIVCALPDIDPELKLKVYRAVTFQALYFPGGYKKTIKYGEEYIEPNANNLPNGAIYINLAAAFGQKYKELQDSVEISVLNEIRKKALGAIIVALKFDQGGRWRQRLQELLRTDVQKDPGDDDLEVFEKDSEFRARLGLT